MTEAKRNHSRNLSTIKSVNCRFCDIPQTRPNVGKHEKFCHQNPDHPRRKTCVNCGKDFIGPSGVRGRSQTTCSHGCSNSMFRRGSNNGNWKNPIDRREDIRYRALCFDYHEKKCVVCQESLVVAVHHMDEDHSNVSPENLIPLCPTHHTYWHSKYRHIIESVVVDYIKRFKLNFGA